MPDEAEQVRAAVVSRYGRLAEAAAAGEQVTDGGSRRELLRRRRLQ